jgi:glycosyltransferase involved in cell wall biosynthesis
MRTLALPTTAHGTVVHSGIDPDRRFQVVHDGVHDVTEFAPSPTKCAGPPVIGILGRLSPWKGQHIFLQAAALVRHQFPEAKFQIIGSSLFQEAGQLPGGSYEAELRDLAGQLGLESSVEFTGFRSDVAAAVDGLTVLVHASTVGEPFGQVVIEGMMAGKPVVATAGGGVPEIIEDGVSGILVPMGEVKPMAGAIMRLLESPQAAGHMGQAARARVLDRFTIQHTVDKVEGVYTALLSPGYAAA